MTDKKMKYREALTLAMSEAMEDPKSMILGQGITDFKGMWGTTSGLSQKYPDRVIETPLSEDAVAGICIGASLNGMYPINTHIRADFGLLIFNQLINIKYNYYEKTLLFILINIDIIFCFFAEPWRYCHYRNNEKSCSS